MRPDAIVIGSGPAGVHAARALLDAGKTVLIVDGGNAAPAILEQSIGNFEDVRRADPAQWKWFLGEDLSGIPVQGIEGGHGGGMTSGNRSYTTHDAERALPLKTTDAFVVQSLATGGLGAAWGGACAIFDKQTLAAMGIDDPAMDACMTDVIRTIGVSGPGDHPDLQPPLPVDRHASRALLRYEQTPERFSVTIERPCNAVLSRPLGERSANELNDMDYYTDAGRSMYRPRWTLDELIARGCVYEPGWIVTRFEETPDGALVHGRSLATDEMKTWETRTVILAAGAIGSARIAAASMGLTGVAIPLVAKPHGYVACVDSASLGDPGPKERLSLCQLLLVDRVRGPDELPAGAAQIYGYRSLLLFRLLSALPLPVPLAMRLLSLLTPSLVLADVRFPGRATDGHTLTLRPDGTVDVRGNPREWDAHDASLQTIKKALRTAGFLPVKTIKGPPGSSSHYAGTIPVSDDPARPLRCDRDGRIHGYERIHVADAAMFRCLPPLPHTLTLMANAYRIGMAITRA